MSSSNQAIRLRLHCLSKDIRDNCAALRDTASIEQDADDIDALLATERDLRRANAAMRKALRADEKHSSVCGCERCYILRKAEVKL